MPLLRIVNHHVNNKFHVDKMIFVEGLPEAILFTKKNGKKYLKSPWIPDVTENIPEYIRAALQPEPIKINVYTAPPEKGMAALDDEIECYGFLIDYQQGNGEVAWKTIERIIDRETPRGEPIPEPVKVAEIDDEHRDRPFSVKVEDIPVVRLKLDVPPAEVQKILETVPPSDLRCPVCNKVFEKERAVRMHLMKTGHRALVLSAGA